MNNTNKLVFSIAPNELDLENAFLKHENATKCMSAIHYANSMRYHRVGWEWVNPPVYAEALLNKALSKYGFKVLVIAKCD